MDLNRMNGVSQRAKHVYQTILQKCSSFMFPSNKLVPLKTSVQNNAIFRRQMSSSKRLVNDQFLKPTFYSTFQDASVPFKKNNVSLYSFFSTKAPSPPPLNTKPTFGGFKQLFGMASGEKKTIFSAIVLLLISSAVTMSIPFGMGKIIDIVFSSPDSLSKLKQVTLGLGFISILGGLANFGRVYLINIASQRIVARSRKEIYSTILKQEIGFFDQTKSGEIVNRLSSDVEVMSRSLTDNVSDGLRSLTQAAGGLGMMLYMSPKLTGVVVGLVPVVGILAMFYGRVVKSISKRVQDSLADTTSIAAERIGNIRTVKAFGQELHELKLYSQSVDHVYAISKQEILAKSVFFGTSGAVGNMIMLGVLFYGGSMMLNHEISIGNLTSFLIYTVYMGISIVGLSSFYAQLMKGVGSGQRIWELQARKSVVSDCGRITIPGELLRGDISFRDIAFVYPSRPDVHVFKNLDLSIKAGSSVAVVGASGSGKSTLAALLLRFYDPLSGALSIDNVSVKELDAHWLRSKIGYVSQEPVLFSGTLSENISYGTLAEMPDIICASRKANAHQFISEFPLGYDTLVGERGVALSGGQKQRIAIARAILRDPKVLILDEATSALDTESESLVQEALSHLMTGRTVIIIAHRLSSIKTADQIVVLEGGKVAEMGSYDVLAKGGALFQKLVEKQ
eukprot:Sdes_comp19717_c0_seq1m11665